MTWPAHKCRTDDTLEHVAQIMWDHDCGAVPVVDDQGRGIAMITDRDICMAAYTQGKLLRDIRVGAVVSRRFFALHLEDSIGRAEALMKMHRVRRLAVVDHSGCPLGMISLGDIARRACSQPPPAGAEPDSVVGTLASVSRPGDPHGEPAAARPLLR
jgi:CBS domain-containing protein